MFHVFALRTKKFIRNLLIRPISIFFPKKLGGGRKGYDWNLTLVGVAQFIYILSIVRFLRSNALRLLITYNSKCTI